MANKKSKNKNKQQPKMSPERFIRERVRKLPIGKCYITPEWEQAGIAQIIITRIRANGNYVVGIFLVDTFCIGIKDTIYYTDFSEDELKELIKHYKSGPGIEEISYNEAHNIIYGAIEFAEEGGIHPVKDFAITKYILEEDTEDVPLIEYDFGKDGKHFLVIGSDRREMHYLNTLKKTLGEDVEYIMTEEDDDDYYDDDSEFSPEDLKKGLENWQAMMEESDRHPEERYAYEYPEYPKTVSVRNQFIADELLSPDNYTELPREVIERILALPADEAAEDISNIVMYVIGKTYKDINDDIIDEPEDGAIMHALLLLTQLRSEKGLDTVLEIMRQNSKFADYHLGDLAPEVIHPALYACALNNVAAIEAYLNQPGLESYIREQAPEALAMIAINHPERRPEIIEVFRRLLTSMETRLPKQEACDGAFAGFVISNLMDIDAKELIPEIKTLFATDNVDRTIAGNCNDVVSELQNGPKYRDTDKYKFPDIYKQYARLKQFSE